MAADLPRDMERSMNQAITGLLVGTALEQLALAQGGVGEVPPAGGYLSITKILIMIAMSAPWLVAAPWIHRDSKLVRAPAGVWGSAAMAVGGIAMAIWLILPYFVAGFLLYALSVSALLVSYLAYRNGRVTEESKIGFGGLFSHKAEKSSEKPLTKLRIYDGTGNIVNPPREDSDEKLIHAYNLTQNLLYEMIWRRASNAELAPTGQQTQLRFVIDGVAIKRPFLSLGESEAIVQYLKPIGGMNIDERRRPQKGRISVDNVGTQVDIVLACAGTTNGQRMDLRVVKEFVQTNLDDLGMGEQMLARLREINQTPNGLFIVSGRPGSGVTSTLFSLLREHDAFIKQLATLESSASIDLENITHHSYGDPANLSKELATVIRRDPDVIMVDRCPDAETASLIHRAAQSKSVLLGMHANDSFTALAKWVKACGSPAPAMENLRGVVCQILMRLLCPECREPYRPDPQLLAKANIPGENIKVFYRPPSQPLTDDKGNVYICPKCQGSGYFGRTAVFELLDITDDLRQLVVSGASLAQIRAAARKRKMLYLQEQALRQVISGQTSIQEVIRVSQ